MAGTAQDADTAGVVDEAPGDGRGGDAAVEIGEQHRRQVTIASVGMSGL